MKMNIKKILKSTLISLAILGVVGGSLNASNANARRRYRTHKVYRHRSKRTSYKLGYWKHHHYYRYKTGYFRNGKWMHRAYRKHSTSHKRYYAPHRKNQNRRKFHKSYKHTWKIYRRDGTLAGVTHNYKTYVNTKRVIDMFYESKKEPTFIIDNSNSNTKKNRQTSQNDNQQATNPEVIAKNLEELKQQTLTDINNDRQSQGLAPLSETPKLENLANIRAQQVTKNFNHVEGDYGENLTETSSGNTEISDGTPITNNNGYDMANNEENAMTNHDSHSDNGHRQNILDPSSTQIGIGASYNQSQSDPYPYKLVEDFK